MKRVLLAAVVIAALSFSGTAYASFYTQTLTSAQLGALSRGKAYTWGIDINSFSIPADQQIVGATLTFVDLHEKKKTRNSQLYIDLLDDPRLNVRKRRNLVKGDCFSNRGILLNWDLNAGSSEDAQIKFTSRNIEMLSTYLRNGKFGFGFDSKGNYLYKQVILEIQTAPGGSVPIPSSLLLTVGGLAAVGALRRRRPISEIS